MTRQLTIERETYTGKDGKEYWAYLVRGVVRGRNVKVDFVPKDTGGYEPLDIVFDVKPTATLIMTDETMTDASGKKTNYTAYRAENIDDDGIVYSCGVKPRQDSDKSLLAMLLNTLNATAAINDTKKDGKRK